MRFLLCATLLVPACAPREAPPPAADTTGTTVTAQPAREAVAEGFATPESAIYDAELQVWFVSNINGVPTDKDGNGFISRLTRDGAVDSLHFIQGGRDGATLNGPKGQAITGDTLWVADIDAVRGFNKRTGAPVRAVEFGRRARFLNDIAVGPDGALYITDTGLLIVNGQFEHPGPDRIFKLAGRTITIVAEGDVLERPNGIAWDAANNRFIMAGFGGNSVFAWAPDSTPRKFAAGPGTQDGVVLLPDGRILVSSWADSAVHVVGDSSVKLITGVASPADIGLDAERRRVAIPLFSLNRVEFWTLP